MGKREVATDLIFKELVNKEALVKKQIEIVENNLSHPVEGRLKVSERDSKFYYYKRKRENGEETCTYITNADINTAKEIALHDYSKKAEKVLLKEQKALKEFALCDFDKELDDCYAKLDNGRKAILSPIPGTVQSVLSIWANEQYEPNLSYPEKLIHETERGERVRSKSEQLIANYLYSKRDIIDYKYERPLELKVNGKKEIVFPDFTVINKFTAKMRIIEHAGRLDLPEYREAFVWKHKAYVDNGLIQNGTVVYSFESEEYPMTVKQIKGLLIGLL